MLHVHWMWWPAIGGIGVGIGGLFFPRGLGVGYDNIAELLRGNAPAGAAARTRGRQVADVGVLAQLRNLRRRAGAVADDRRRHRRSLAPSSRISPARRRRSGP